jgi:hypothetical protein
MQEKVQDKGREKGTETATEVRVDARTGAAPLVKWDDSDMKTSYSNVCNVASTREEVTLLFGTHQNWHSAQKEVSVRLSDRIILNPHAAKRFARLLAGVVAEYEKRFGPLGPEMPEGGVH